MDELHPSDPRQIGAYRISARLGVGGMGRVYLGKSPGGRLVAVKVIHREHASTEEFRTRFRREVTAMRSVSGVFTAAVIDADLEASEPWLATAYVPGPSLAEALDKGGPLPPASVLVLAAGLGEALHAIHGAGLAHRDLKPSNVLLADDGPRVIDFGLAVTRQSSALTQAGTVMGTIGYMSPEQVEGKAVGPASDVFSYGVLLVHAATGRLPFSGESTGAVLYSILNNEPALTGIEGPLLGIVKACLHKDAALRPTSTQLMTMLAERATGTAVPEGGWLPSNITGLAQSLPAGPPPAQQQYQPQQKSHQQPSYPGVPPLPYGQATYPPRPLYAQNQQSYQPPHPPPQPPNPYATPTAPQGVHSYPMPSQIQGQMPGYGMPGYPAPYGPGYPIPFGPGYQIPALANWGRRVAAWLLDLLILAVPFTVFSVGSGGRMASASSSHDLTTGAYTSSSSGSGTAGAIVLGYAWFLIIGLVQLTMQGRTGATIGKRIVGIRLISETTLRPIGFWACLGRELCHFVDSLAFCTGWFAPLWTKKRQTYADMMVGTVVVKV